MPPLRRLLYAAVAIVALAAVASWIAQRGPRKFGEPLEVASVERASSDAPLAVQPRRGAGTIGARAGSLGAVAAPREYESRASQHGDAEEIARYGRAPRPAPKPDLPSVSTDATEGDDAPAEIAWSGRGVEDVPPPTPGRDPRDSEPAQEGDAPPVFGGTGSPSFDPPVPSPEVPTTRNDSPSRETPSDPGEGVTADGPLTPEQIDAIVDQKLAGLPDDQANALREPLREEVATNADVACGLTRCQP